MRLFSRRGITDLPGSPRHAPRSWVRASHARHRDERRIVLQFLVEEMRAIAIAARSTHARHRQPTTGRNHAAPRAHTVALAAGAITWSTVQFSLNNLRRISENRGDSRSRLALDCLSFKSTRARRRDLESPAHRYVTRSAFEQRGRYSTPAASSQGPHATRARQSARVV